LRVLAGEWGFGQPAFFSYAYPEPPGFAAAPVRPAGTYYDQGLGQFILPYDAIRLAPSPDADLWIIWTAPMPRRPISDIGPRGVGTNPAGRNVSMVDDEPPRLRLEGRFYMTPDGHARLRNELDLLLRVERPRVVEVVSWAASNGDRSENADYNTASAACGRSTGARISWGGGWRTPTWSIPPARLCATGSFSVPR